MLSRHIMLKLFKTSDREECEKQPEKKTQCIYKNEAQDDSRFLLENSASQVAVEGHLQSNKRKKNCQPRILFLVKISFKDKGNIKSFSDILKAKFITGGLPLKICLKECSWSRRKMIPGGNQSNRKKVIHWEKDNYYYKYVIFLLFI